MTERSRRILYRLYGLAECTYFYMTREFYELKEENKHSKERIEFLKKEKEELERLNGKSIVVREEPEDNDGDEWTMFQKDYDTIREIMEVYDGQLTLMKRIHLLQLEAEDENT